MSLPFSQRLLTDKPYLDSGRSPKNSQPGLQIALGVAVMLRTGEA
jgi:hypothetical protein